VWFARRYFNPRGGRRISVPGLLAGVPSVLTRRRLLVGAGATAGLAATAGCLGGGSESRASDPDVAVRLTPDLRFAPETVRVAAGETVRWENEGRRPGTVTAYEDTLPPAGAYFASGGVKREVTARMLYPLLGALSHGDSYRFTFETPGEYGYFSVPTESEGTTGTVVVTEG
jgi:plastocyanin